MVQSCCSGTMVVFIIVLALQTDVAAIEIKVINEADEFLMIERDPLIIVCSSHEQISFEYPVLTRETISSPIEEEIRPGLYTSMLNLTESFYIHTGLYGCRNSRLEIISPRYYKPQKSYVYIYVQSNNCKLVNSHHMDRVNVTVGGSVIIPCKPTSPNCTVVLNDSRTMVPEQVPFNPRIGFTLMNLTLFEDGKQFYCELEKPQSLRMEQNISEWNSYILSVFPHDTVKKSKTIYIPSNCFPKLDRIVEHYFRWSISQQGRESVQFLRENSSEIGGCYQCNIRNLSDDTIAKKCITIHDPEFESIYVEIQGKDGRYNLQEGGKVQWTVYVDYSSPVKFKWLNTKGEEIVNSQNYTKESRYIVISEDNSTTLKIESLKLKDEGVYTVQANYSNNIKSLNFTLHVSVKPTVSMLVMKSYYAPNETANIFCSVAAFPKPNITWNFKPCYNYYSCEEERIVELRNLIEITATNDKNTGFASTLNMTTEMSGQLSCTACNRVGCDDLTKDIVVSALWQDVCRYANLGIAAVRGCETVLWLTLRPGKTWYRYTNMVSFSKDVPSDFGITASKNFTVEGDDLELTCFVTTYNRRNNFRWTYQRPTTNEENSRLIVTNITTQYSYRSILTIKNVTKADSMSYVCANGERASYNLSVRDGIAPFFNCTNLNGSATTFDLATEHRAAIMLECFVTGLPKPKVSWYKDNEELKIGGRYECSNDCQEFHLNNLRYNDSGNYSCYVENRFGKLKASQRIIVQGVVRPIQELIVSVVILLIITVVLFICFMIKVCREKFRKRELKEAGLMHFEEGELEQLNPNLTLDDQAKFLPYDKRWEFPREELKLGKQLGKGAFGIVFKAEARQICEGQLLTTVAVKTVPPTANSMSMRALATELKIMVHLGKHLNVVNLLGACTRNISKCKLLVIVEYCQFGNLHDYLSQHRAEFINQIDPVSRKFDPNIGRDRLGRQVKNSSNRTESRALSFPSSLNDSSDVKSPNSQSSSVDSQGDSNNFSQPEWSVNYKGDYNNHDLKPICTQDLLSWAFQVARGMEYLSGRKVVHADLAARNILLAEGNVVKICDFGLAKIIREDSNYEMKGDALLPIRWMAIEAIRDRILSTQSDIWSYGIVLWELFTLAKTPYAPIRTETVCDRLVEGYRMEQPKYATSEVYDIMLECWKANPSLRPTFTQLIQDVGNLLEKDVRALYINLNGPYLDMNAKRLEKGETDYVEMFSAPNYQVLREYSNYPNLNRDSTYLCMSSTSSGQNSIQLLTFDKPMPEKQEDDDPLINNVDA